MLAVIAVPEFSMGDAAWIDAIRRAHDSQVEQVAAHVTLVFPFESADPDWFAGHVGAIAAVTAPLTVGFDRLAGSGDFAPHVTLTRFGAVFSAKAFERQLGALAAPMTGRIAALQLLRIEHGNIRCAGQYDLRG